jgi:hypothetical protein
LRWRLDFSRPGNGSSAARLDFDAAWEDAADLEMRLVEEEVEARARFAAEVVPLYVPLASVEDEVEVEDGDVGEVEDEEEDWEEEEEDELEGEMSIGSASSASSLLILLMGSAAEGSSSRSSVVVVGTGRALTRAISVGKSAS